MNFPKTISRRLKANESLKTSNSFRIGGKARFWFEPNDKGDLVLFLRSLDSSLPIFVIGAGSNVLLGDGLIQKIFIHLSSPSFKKLEISGTKVRAGAGLALSRFVSVLKSKDFSGFEFLAGIPGTVGGALVMNAGARVDFSDKNSYRSMGDIVVSVEVMDPEGKILKITRKDLKFFYRSCDLKRYIVLSAVLRFQRNPRQEARQKIEILLKNRRLGQDWRYPSAGSFFKNPSVGKTAGWLIEQCGCKGLSVGDAQVSLKHANFIINKKEAKSRDVRKLMEIVQRRVYNRFKIKLKPEVKIVI